MGILGTNATADKNNSVKLKVVAIGAGQGNTAVALAADSELIGGKIIGVYPTNTTNDMDTYITDVTLGATGIVSVRLSGNSTAAVNVTVAVALATGNIA